AVGDPRGRPRLGHRVPRLDGRERGAAPHRRRPGRRAVGTAVGVGRLLADVERAAPVGRRARRRVRPQAVVRVRADLVHRRLRPVRPRAEHRRADRGASPPRCGRGDARSGQPLAHHRQLPHGGSRCRDRRVVLINLPLAAVALFVTLRHVPESRDPQAGKRPDFAGAATATVGLGGLVYALIQGPAHGWSPFVVALGVIGAAALVAFPFVEMRVRSPLVPLEIFRSRQFSGANATTFVVYAALGVALFLVVVELQTVLGYSALEAGTATLPITVLMLFLSPRAGRLSQRIGPRIPMTVGPLVVAVGLVLLAGIGPGTTYFTGIFPGLVVFGLGLSLTVAPLTAAVMGSVEENHVGVGSGVNNAVARIAGLLAVAVLP